MFPPLGDIPAGLGHTSDPDSSTSGHPCRFGTILRGATAGKSQTGGQVPKWRVFGAAQLRGRVPALPRRSFQPHGGSTLQAGQSTSQTRRASMQDFAGSPQIVFPDAGPG